MCSAFTSPATSPNEVPPKATILCVDDSQEMLLICQTILEAGGLEVLTASDGPAALEALRQHPIDVAVIDNRMPGMTGIELAKRIRNSYSSLPILMFSDSGPEPEWRSTIDLFLNKQGGPRAMRDAVKQLLEKSLAAGEKGEA